MRDLTSTDVVPDLDLALAAIDQANESDPNLIDGRPRALLQGTLATNWLNKLASDAGPELQLAVRAHHLRRWEVRRNDYPDGRAGYLKWRRDNKAHQADALASIMTGAGWGSDSIERARTLLHRTRLTSDAETQTLEDAACLVFLETQFETMTEKTDRDHLVSIVAKTLKKMSAAAVELAGSVGLSAAAESVLSDAAAKLE